MEEEKNGQYKLDNNDQNFSDGQSGAKGAATDSQGAGELQDDPDSQFRPGQMVDLWKNL